jgi:hypothetical protein
MCLTDFNSVSWSPVAAKPKVHALFLGELFKEHYPQLVEKLNGRIERAVAIVSRVGACRTDPRPNIWLVESQSGKGYYEVNTQEKTCTCPDSAKGNLCKHRLAIGLHLSNVDWIIEYQKNLFSKL